MKKAPTFPIFEEWLKGRRFVNFITNQPCYFYALGIPQRHRIVCEYEKRKDAWERKQKDIQIQERILAAANRAEARREAAERRKRAWTDRKLEKYAKEWRTQAREDYPEENNGLNGPTLSDACSDCAEGLLYMEPELRHFLSRKGIHPDYHREYVADILHG